MSDEFRRLLQDRPGAQLQTVLEAGLSDRPSLGALGRTARALGIGAAGLGAAQSAAASETARVLHTSLWASLAKWGAAGLVIGGVALSPLVLTAPSARPGKVVLPGASQPLVALSQSAMAPPVRVRLPAPAAVVSDAPGPATSVAVVQPRESASAMPVAPSEPNVATAAAGPSSGSFPSLAPLPTTHVTAADPDHLDTEVALLDSARAALKGNAPNAALELLDRHARVNEPSLGAEATLLRVQALVAVGRLSEAREVARRALGNTTASAYAQRLRKLTELHE